MVNSKVYNKKYEFSNRSIFKKRIDHNYWGFINSLSNPIHIIHDWQIIKFSDIEIME